MVTSAVVPGNNPHTKAWHDASTITDVCSGGDVPEVEIISLLEERLPHYTLRADTIFGYDHDDWLLTPLLPPDIHLDLTAEQITETLKYFLLCSERVGQVTKTYHDIDAVTNLLEEKERDLELAARIGQSLLNQNQSLTERNEFLEEQLDIAKEETAQLRHEVAMRDDLLHVFMKSTEESEPAPAISPPLRRCGSSFALQYNFQLDVLQQKLKELEEENQKLRNKASSIVHETSQYEEQEEELMIDCVEQFAEASRQVALLSEEMGRKTEDMARQQEEVSQLLAHIVDLQQKCRTRSAENEELQQHLSAAKEVQQQLQIELQDLQEKYAECKNMLNEAREEVKALRSRNVPNSTVNCYSSLNIFPLDSLAAEIEGSMRKGLDGSASSEHRSYRRVFETVKTINQVSKGRSCCPSPHTLPSSRPSSEVPSAVSSRPSTPQTSCPELESAGSKPSSDSTQLHGQEQKLGMPGTPGSQDLVAALQQLSAQQDASSLETERELKLRKCVDSSSGLLTPNESILSTGTNYSGSSGLTGGSNFSYGSRSYLPDKLQIIKPLEGSVTLHHWQQLAKPNLGGILDLRPGVLTKDFRKLDVDTSKVYNLNDLEEDDVDISFFQAGPTSTPSKAIENTNVSCSINNLPQTPSTYTITTCHILHPANEITMVTPSLHNMVLSCGSLENLNSISSEPQRLQPPQNSTSGKNAPLGLLNLLKERGISATILPPEIKVVSSTTQSEETPKSPLSYPFRLRQGDPYNRTFQGLGFASPLLRARKGVEPDGKHQTQQNIFSFNLVEKLKRLKLDKVVERGVIFFDRTEEMKCPIAKASTTSQPT
uniref:Huntingtin-associated protein 1 n=1 Tax=Geotrypetes seraphini TaxID=260995 RepID=A0A6P8NHG3_GEOSA|nr:huntingtin-associated protein 1 [Geotrypetes seraphini]XP_033775318.1 huntingtin-associated protein 1 [Geotrypetes seraphini]XP_033775319.1 huntingtin-associated protein 1 [Geotrypetes seraphini]XP_033775320.1 huntingtin-associated protein 1 [Geotrypetes seraphini]